VIDLETLIAALAILLALGFDFVNGFHDTANACATVIYTKALKPGVAIVMSGVLNFLGALLVGTAVAQVITKIIPVETVTLPVVVAVLLAALIWNLITWWFGIPVSSSHCLIASLFGAGVTAAGVKGVEWHELWKVLTALFISPIVGFISGALLTWVTLKLSREQLHDSRKTPQSKVMRTLHVIASAFVSFTHGSNDGQKTMGIITLILATHFARYGYRADHVPLWVMAAAATAMAIGHDYRRLESNSHRRHQDQQGAAEPLARLWRLDEHCRHYPHGIRDWRPHQHDAHPELGCGRRHYPRTRPGQTQS
jgi:PiT family inorganic phosphate transporter